MSSNGFDTPKVRGVRRLGLPLPFRTMPKTTRTYWNPLADEHRDDWQPIEGLEGMAEELTLAIDEASTRAQRAAVAKA